MLLVSGATATMRKMNDPRLGELFTPGRGNSHLGKQWAADNGAFAGFDAKKFLDMLARIQGYPAGLWVACPDVVADAAATEAMFREWEPRIHGRGFPVAYVGQDCVTEPPWDSLECLFVGGSTEWKLGLSAHRLCAEAKRRGKLVHVGRVNTMRRFRAAMDMGADSIDGTAFSMYPEIKIPQALAWMDAQEEQVGLKWF